MATLRGTARTVLAVAGTCVALAGVVVTAKGAPADAAARHHHVQRVLDHTLAYRPDGVQMQCRRSELGELAIVTGDGKPFVAKCENDGPIDVWDSV